MQLKFTKMQGCGNDYIYINCFEPLEINNPSSLAIFLSNRNFGIGGDGLVLIMPACAGAKADARMRMFNLDGSEGKMCGNAIRCVAKYLYEHKLVSKLQMRIETLSGIKELYLSIENDFVYQCKVDMGAAELQPENIPINLPGKSIINQKIAIGGKDFFITCVSMGNPHAVVFCNDVEILNLEKIGPKFENSLLFSEGINTEFAQLIARNHLKMRVWERGSGETLACGTGACACAVAAVLNGYCDKNTDIIVDLRGGRLTVNYTDDAVFMTGACVEVFSGVIEI